jgi:RNA polymerase sigma-70 factor (ECF subfamily)
VNRKPDKILNEKMPDNVLRAALKRNDPAAVELLWDRYAKDLFAYLQAVLCSRHDAEDALQAVFIRIVQKRHRLAKARLLDAYVYRIARNEAFRLIDRRKKERSVGDINESWMVVSEDKLVPNDMAERLQNALAGLPQSQREVIVMKIYRQKTFLEISRLLGISQNTAASRYRYGMEKLRSLLGDIIS